MMSNFAAVKMYFTNYDCQRAFQNPTPPSHVSTTEYDEHFDYWVGRVIPRLGRITKIVEDKYWVAKQQVTHSQLMSMVSKARGSGLDV